MTTCGDGVTFDGVASGTLHIVIGIGANFRLPVIWTADDEPVDITGYTARAQVRARKDATTALLEFTTENDRITLGGETGEITLEVGDDITTTLLPGSGVWDLEMISPTGNVRRLLQGRATLSGDVTR